MTRFAPMLLNVADLIVTPGVGPGGRQRIARAYVALKAAGRLTDDSAEAVWVQTHLDTSARGNLDTLAAMQQALDRGEPASLRGLAERLTLRDAAARRRLATLISILPRTTHPGSFS